MTYRATLHLAAEQLLRLADEPDPGAVFEQLGHMLHAGEGGLLKAALVQARAEAAEAVVEAEGGSQVRAAERLGVAAPTISRQLARLGR